MCMGVSREQRRKVYGVSKPRIRAVGDGYGTPQRRGVGGVGKKQRSVSAVKVEWLVRELAAPPHIQRFRPAISHAGDENTPG
jgi:hypothetical protein